jgi:uncharacterized repeat protein (TIGR03803 family)
VNFIRFVCLAGVLGILATTVSAQTFTVLHNFELADGQNPMGMLTRDSAGSLYGTTRFGGDLSQQNDGYGVVFELANSNGSWKESTVYKFSDTSDGSQPETGLIAGPGGVGYGAAPFGGSFTGNSCLIGGGCGTVYTVGSGGKFSVLYSFSGSPDGQQPFSPLLQGASGSLYGTTELGGTLDCSMFNSLGCGTVYEVNTSGTEQVIYSFLGPNNNSDGATPFSALVQDASGNLYGSTTFGGIINNNANCGYNAGCGTLFELTPNSNGTWTETVLYRFQGGADGDYPAVSLFSDSDGSLYGTTPVGGNLSDCGGLGCGTIFKLSQTNGQWSKTVLYTFGGADGDMPITPLTRDTAGNSYGATQYGGNLNCKYYLNTGCGVVFKLTPSGKETVLHQFSGTDGLYPGGGVLLNQTAGVLYGTTMEGGDIAHCTVEKYYIGCGVVYEITK